ncbi:MAG: hypothetical protein ABSA44_05640 [Bacteroidota bacterium]|jgi:hypothetical protein
MRVFFLCLSILIIVSAVGFGQEKIDVVYLKNGDVRKGTIIENTPNDYIKIETYDGSIFTIKYTDIQKMAKETKSVSATQISYVPQNTPKGLMSRTADFGVTAALWLGGKVRIVDYDIKTDKNPGFLLRAFYDAYVVEKLAVGAYANFSPVSVEWYSTTAAIYEVGGAIKGRFPLGDGSIVIKPGLNIGYRMISSDYYIIDKSDAMALNASIEIQFNTKNLFVPFFEIGFLAQPVGGNDYTNITFPPIIYLGGGVAF